MTPCPGRLGGTFFGLSDSPLCLAAGLQGGSLKLSAPENCSSRYHKLMQRCWAASPKDRPSFSDIANALGDSPSDSKM